MSVDEDQLPAIGTDAYQLGARVGADVVPDAHRLVAPGLGQGMSCFAVIAKMPPAVRPDSHPSGQNYRPAFAIESVVLPDGLAATQFGKNRDHHLIEAAEPMHVDAYQTLLASTRSNWEIVK